MPKSRELSHKDRLKVVTLRENGFSYPKIGRIVGCQHSTALRIWQNFEKTGSVMKQRRVRSTEKIAGKGGTVRVQCSKEVAFQLFEDHKRGGSESFWQ